MGKLLLLLALLVLPAGSETRAVLRVGMTRAQVEKAYEPDGGLTAPFRMERYVLRSTIRRPRVVKVTLQFKPAGMSREVYRLGKWAPPSPGPETC